jgi:hypothetical protein
MRRTLFVLSLATPALPACSSGSGNREGGCDSLLPGDIIVTEIMSNPDGDDKGQEWFELYNATSELSALGGVDVVYSRPDATDAKTHTITGLDVDAGGYVVLGAMLNDPTLLAPHVQYGYGNDLGEMRQSDGRVAVVCGDTVIDAALYEESGDGTSRAYTGDRTPDAAGNDDLALWCDSTTEFAPGSFGTPGAVNDACPITAPAGSCIEDGAARPIVAPGPGDIVITEFHSNPAIVEDAAGEWIEVRANAAFDLNDVLVGRDEDEPDPLTVAECIHLEPGDYALIAREIEANGGLPPVDATFSFSLINSNGSLFVANADEELDRVTWTSSESGAATALAPEFSDPTENDDEANWCPATAPYGDGDFGTPGEENTACGGVSADTCLDGGTPRDIRRPGPGGLLVTELHPNPAAVGDTEGEWFELYANEDFDLNGLELSRTEGEIDETIVDPNCLPVATGGYAVIARERKANGGLPQVDATFGFSLVNSDGYLAIGSAGTVIDELGYASSFDGATRSLDPAFTDPADNDDETRWCAGTTAYGDGDLGTPGEANPACGGVATGTCLDGDTERDVISPTVGQLVITEIMPDPSAVTDANGEWFELLATGDFDLNGVSFGHAPGDPDSTLEPAGPCLEVGAGQRVVIAKSIDPLVNGDLPQADYSSGSLSLANAGGTLVVEIGATLIDQAGYAGATSGHAWTLDAALETAEANDLAENFCVASDLIGDGPDFGTPGTTGPSCGGKVNPDQCLDGGVPRDIVVPQDGDLVISEFMANPDVVSDTDGEWFEIHATADVDLNGLEISRFAGGVWSLETTLMSGSCLEVTAGSSTLFARNLDAGINGGLPAPPFTFSFSLNNTNSGLRIGEAGTPLDDLNWAASTAGASTNVDPDGLTPAGNDVAANVCTGTVPYGPGDNLGTPGVDNSEC